MSTEVGAPWGYRPALDGVRAIAIYLVVVYHSPGSFTGGPLVPHGFIGVDLFFVLSGFIVTNVLLTEHRSSGRIELRRFYARRVRRLLPAAIVCIVSTALVFVLVATLFERLDYVADAQSALVYVANWHFIAESNDYFALNTEVSPYLHFWSLAIEEQFYIIYPPLLLLLLRLRSRGWSASLLAGLGGLAVVSLLLQLVWFGSDPVRSYYGSDARAYQLLAGALLAVAFTERKPPTGSWVGSAISVGGLVGIGALAMTFDPMSVGHRGVLATISALALIAGVEAARGGIVGRVLAMRVPVYLGSISYATYLWHWPVALIVGRLLRIGPATTAVIVAVLATSIASLSQQLIEHPIRSARRLDRVPRTVIGVGLASSVVCAVAVVPPILESSRPPRLVAASEANRAAISGEDQVPTDIDFGAVRSARADLPSCPPDDPADCRTRHGTGSSVVVIGDSVARSFVPTLESVAEEEGWSLIVNVQAGCGWYGTPRAEGGERAPFCEARRTTWYREVLPQIDPDVVVLLQGTDESGAPADEEMLGRFDSDVDLMVEAGAHVVLIDSYPVTPEPSPTDCLSGSNSISACGFRLEDAARSQRFIDAASRRADVSLIELTPLVCPGGEICPAMIGSVPVWRDRRGQPTAFHS